MFRALFGLFATAAAGSRLDVSVLFIMVVMTTVRLTSPRAPRLTDGRVHGGGAASWKQLKMAFLEYAFLACVFASTLQRLTLTRACLHDSL